MFQIAEQRPNHGGLIHVNPLVDKALERIDELLNSDSDITGVSTGFADLDGMTTGWQSGDLVILAARPAMGKTTFAMNMVEEAALNQDKPVVVFSLEMPADQLITRSIASLGRIDMGRVRTGKLQDDDFPKLTKAVNLLKDRKLFIDDTPGISPTEMRSRIRRLVREHGDIGLIVVDYLQLMKIKGFKRRPHQRDFGKSRARSRPSPRNSTARSWRCRSSTGAWNSGPNKRPVNSDLRESGAIEQDADIILFIYRDEVYNEDSKDKGTAEIIIGKQRERPHRHLPAGLYRSPHSRFENLAPDQYGRLAERMSRGTCARIDPSALTANLARCARAGAAQPHLGGDQGRRLRSWRR